MCVCLCECVVLCALGIVALVCDCVAHVCDHLQGLATVFLFFCCVCFICVCTLCECGQHVCIICMCILGYYTWNVFCVPLCSIS